MLINTYKVSQHDYYMYFTFMRSCGTLYSTKGNQI